MVHHALVAGPTRAFDGFRRKGQPIEAKRPPNYPHPLWVRAGTSDILTRHMVVRRGEYDLPLRAGSPKVILDLGASIGLTAVWYANDPGPITSATKRCAATRLDTTVQVGVVTLTIRTPYPRARHAENACQHDQADLRHSTFLCI